MRETIPPSRPFKCGKDFGRLLRTFTIFEYADEVPPSGKMEE